MAHSPVRVGFLGMGGMGFRHAGNMEKLQGVSIAAMCSLPKSDAERFNTQHQSSYPVYEDFQRMLDEVPMDVLYVCLPPYAHNGQIEAAAKKGIHIFAEKPLALTVERGESIARAVKQSGVHSQMGYHMRFGEAVARFKELLEAGTAGRPTLYSASYECNSLHSPWWRVKEQCGGQVFEQVIHLYDMALYCMGEAGSVAGHAANLCHVGVPGYTVEDTSAMTLRFTSGAMGSITGSNCAVPGLWNARFRMVFEHMVADFTDYNHAKFIYTKDGVREETVDSTCDPYLEEDKYFISVIRGEQPEFAPISEGLSGLKLVSAAMESAQRGGMIITL